MILSPKPNSEATKPSVIISMEKGSSCEEHAVEEEAQQPDYISGWTLAMVVTAVTLGCGLMMLDMSIVVTAIPDITTTFASLDDLGWYGSSYMLSSAALQPLTGKLYSLFPPKWLYIEFVALFLLGNLICAVATSSAILIIGRAVAGLGGSGLMNGAFTIIAASAPLSRRPALTGVVMGVGQLGLLAGPLIGGAFTQYATWRWCFWINLPVGGILILMLALIHVPNPNPPLKLSVISTIIHRLDLPGFALFAPSAVMCLLGLEYSPHEFGWASATTIGLFVGAGVMALLFLIWERHVQDEAMIPLSMFRNRIVGLSTVVGATIMCGIVISSFYIPVYFQSVYDTGPMMSGVYLLPVVISQLSTAIIGGILMGRTGYYLVFAVVGGAINVVGTALITTWSPSTNTGEWIGYQILLGAGRGLTLQVPLIAIQAALPSEKVSVAIAFLVFSQTFVGSVFLSAANVIFNNRLHDGITLRAPGIDADFVVGAGATGFRAAIPDASIYGVLLAYCHSLSAVFYLLVALGSVGFILSFGLGWKDIRDCKNSTETASNTLERTSAEING